MVVILGVLFAMLMSTRPKQYAIALCLISLSLMVGIDYLMAGVYQYYAFIGVELAAVAAILTSARVIPKAADRKFFRIMAGMLIASLFVTWGYLFDHLTFAAYSQLWRLVALIHIGIMLVYSDGIRAFVGGVLSLLHRAGLRLVVHR